LTRESRPRAVKWSVLSRACRPIRLKQAVVTHQLTRVSQREQHDVPLRVGIIQKMSSQDGLAQFRHVERSRKLHRLLRLQLQLPPVGLGIEEPHRAPARGSNGRQPPSFDNVGLQSVEASRR
jgi:hypothetical protein